MAVRWNDATDSTALMLAGRKMGQTRRGHRLREGARTGCELSGSQGCATSMPVAGANEIDGGCSIWRCAVMASKGCDAVHWISEYFPRLPSSLPWFMPTLCGR